MSLRDLFPDLAVVWEAREARGVTDNPAVVFAVQHAVLRIEPIPPRPDTVKMIQNHLGAVEEYRHATREGRRPVVLMSGIAHLVQTLAQEPPYHDPYAGYWERRP